ncbi:MAG: DEAD/DEAH box helicase [Gemmatimonadaceae bacterium]|nr:DEAD/DEAH box helicase [Gemmatimonadaceae bacterium]
MGAYTLRDAQTRTLDALHRSLTEFGGALCADSPGSGKTVIALAAAHLAAHVAARTTARAVTDVVAPAALRDQWEHAAARAATSIRFTSMEALSRSTSVARETSLLIIDEAHHVRSPTTRRYRAVAELCVGRPVLLLTATPVINRLADRDHLLALFLGERAYELNAAALSRIIVRTHEETALHARVVSLPPLAGAPQVEGLAEALRALPAPLPAAEGRAALPLIVMSLALAWQSSLAALDAALRRRLQRGVAFDALLSAGRSPSRAAIARWVLTDDVVQLSFAALDERPDDSPDFDLAAARRQLDAHLDAVRALRRRIATAITADTAARATALRQLLREHPSERVVVFARHADTIRALSAALRAEPGVVTITGTRVRAASGRWTRTEVLRALGPDARTFDAADPRGIRLLLATDVVSEGIELQGASIMVHADLPWTPARIAQRRGRVARIGQRADSVYVVRFAQHEDTRALLRLGARLRRKSRVAAGAVEQSSAWRRIESALAVRTSRDSKCAEDRAEVKCTERPHITAFIAALRDASGTKFVGAWRHRDAWRVTTRPTRIATLLETHAAHRAHCLEAREASIAARRVLKRVVTREAARRLLGGVPRTLARLHQALDAELAAAPTLQRPALAMRLQRLRARVGDHLERAREAEVRALLTARERGALHDLVGATETLLRDRAVPPNPRPAASVSSTEAGATSPYPARLVRLLLLSPASPRSAPPAASTDTAAPRRVVRVRSPSRRSTAAADGSAAAAPSPAPCPPARASPCGAQSPARSASR